MDVPVDRSKMRGEFQFAVELRHPKDHGQAGIERAEQKERPEAVAQESRALIVAKPWYRHESHS
jgi:hypothetical protein